MLHEFKYKQNIRQLFRRAYRYKVHFAIASVSILYFIGAPVIYANYFIEFGKHIKINGELPFSSDEIHFNIDRNEAAIVDGDQYQQIIGWAVLPAETDQSKYEKYLVLNSETKTYYFACETMNRPDLQTTFKAMEIDVLSSGFRVLISSDNLSSGTYNVGFLLKNIESGKGYYSVSNQYFVRSPNHTDVKLGEKPVVEASGKLAAGYKNSIQDGMGIQLNQPLPTQTKRIKSYVETVSRVSINGKSYGRLAGWSFLIGTGNQENYDRLIIFESTSGKYYFPTIQLDRPDVVAAFDFPYTNLENSGVDSYFLLSELPYDTYKIGIVYLDKSKEEIFYSRTNRSLIWSADKFEFNRK